jgi:hypothetical protein
MGLAPNAIACKLTPEPDTREFHVPDSISTDQNISTRHFQWGAIAEWLIRLFAIGVPLLYMVGRAYSQGYWDSLGLPESLMGYAIEDYLYFGALAPLHFIAELFGQSVNSRFLWIILGSLAFTLLALAITLVERWFSRLSSRASDLAKKWKLSKRIRKLEPTLPHIATFLAGSFVGIVSLLLVGLLILPIALASQSGRAQADRQTNRLAEFEYNFKGSIPSFPMGHYMAPDGAPRAGIVSDCSDTWCVVFAKGSYSAIPTSAISQIDHIKVSDCAANADSCSNRRDVK